MSMGGDGQERTEEASPRRKQDARRDGQVAKSQDLVGALVTVALVATLPALVGNLGQGFVNAVHLSLSQLTTNAEPGSIARAFAFALTPSLPGLGFLLLVPLTVGVIATVAQTGFLVTAKPMMPSFQKIDPMAGAKRLFSKRSLMEGLKAFAKFGFFGGIGYSVLAANAQSLGSLSDLPPAAALAVVGEIARTVALRIGMAWMVIAAVDYFFQRRQNDQRLKMTKDEVKREHKDSEGSPEIKAARHQRRRRLMKQRTRDAVRTADVIVTNPTHFAVALKYDPASNAAPIVVAKGVDHLAAKIREFAREDKVPIVPNPRLARALYKQCEIGDTIPKELFAAVAEVLAFVYKVLRRVNQ